VVLVKITAVLFSSACFCRPYNNINYAEEHWPEETFPVALVRVVCQLEPWAPSYKLPAIVARTDIWRVCWYSAAHAPGTCFCLIQRTILYPIVSNMWSTNRCRYIQITDHEKIPAKKFDIRACARFSDQWRVATNHPESICSTTRERTTGMQMISFWDIAPCSLVELNRHFRGAYCLHHYHPDDGDGTHL
jgi:hypothetical protein